MTQQFTPNLLSLLGDELCPGCKQATVNENRGLVVAFGQSFFHLDCFACVKCHRQVPVNTSVIMLPDGSPICADCPSNCIVCHQPIIGEAIMTGDDWYHVHCLNCRSCHNRISELVFAKTSHNIYCMTCHNERMAKVRRHVRRKQEPANAASGSKSSSTRKVRESAGETSVGGYIAELTTPDGISETFSTGSASFRDSLSMRSLDQSTEHAWPFEVIGEEEESGSLDQSREDAWSFEAIGEEEDNGSLDQSREDVWSFEAIGEEEEDGSLNQSRDDTWSFEAIGEEEGNGSLNQSKDDVWSFEAIGKDEENGSVYGSIEL